jgi:hypothetical protein
VGAALDPLPKPSASARPEDLLFFSRIRKQAKWVFALLALVFAGTFVFLGVGSGNAGIGDLLQSNVDFLGGGGDGNPDVTRARIEAEDNPQNAQAWLDYAHALQADNRAEDAVVPLERYVELRPQDIDGLQELAGAYAAKLQRVQTEAQLVQYEAQAVQPVGALTLGSSPLGQEVGRDKIYDAISGAATQRLTEAYGRAQEAGQELVGVYRRIAQLQPADPSWQLQLIFAAQTAGDTTTEIAASERFLELSPEDPSAAQIRQRLRQLRSSQQSAPTPAAGG